MPALLKYEIVTDPTSLQVSTDGVPSVGTVYVIASNTHQAAVDWEYIDIEVPVGKDAEHLTDNPAAIRATVSKTGNRKWRVTPTVVWDGQDRFRAKDPGEDKVTLRGHEALVLKLENIPVSGVEGLVLLTIHEKAEGGDNVVAERSGHYTTVLGVAKQTSKAPRNFRAEKSLLNVDAGETLVLEWDGPSNLDYWVLDAEGAPIEHIVASLQGPVVQDGYSVVVDTPKRGTTYTLVAAAAGADRTQAGFFLTTTVHARIPEFESGTRALWIEGTAARGRVGFVADGVEIRTDAHAPGRVAADSADVQSVKTVLVRGRGDADGWIDFPETGIDVFHGLQRDLGTVDADTVRTRLVHGREEADGGIDFPRSGINVFRGPQREAGNVTAHLADVDGVKTRWVQGRDDSAGWIDFPDAGINVFHGSQRDLGTVTAHGVHSAWVQGPDGSAGWIEFPPAGLNVFKGEGSRQWGTVAAGKADLDDLLTARAVVKERLTIQGGLTVGDVLETQEGPARLVVHGRLEAQDEVHAGRDLVVDGSLTVHGDVRPLRNLEVGGTVSAGDLTVGGKLTTSGDYALTVHGDSVFEGKVNANRHLSVRGESGWILHVNDEKLAIQGDFWVSGQSLFHGKVNANDHLSVRSKSAGWILHTNDDKVAIQADLRVHGAFRADS
ncbi:polymer-forming cytoskeletal protein [Kitasatospora sp. NPDC001527]|uniref:polymer-forming cytoskeletal protein n=1 Tax=Kitasatospora sp. NPDC001527 TaxID=3154519 RepID=UPI00331E5FC6